MIDNTGTLFFILTAATITLILGIITYMAKKSKKKTK